MNGQTGQHDAYQIRKLPTDQKETMILLVSLMFSECLTQIRYVCYMYIVSFYCTLSNADDGGIHVNAIVWRCVRSNTANRRRAELRRRLQIAFLSDYVARWYFAHT